MGDRLPKLGETASGKPEILIARSVSYSGFSKVASGFAKKVNARVVNKADSVMERVWTITIEGRSFCLSWDDWDSDVTVFAWDDSDNDAIKDIFSRLMKE